MVAEKSDEEELVVPRIANRSMLILGFAVNFFRDCSLVNKNEKGFQIDNCFVIYRLGKGAKKLELCWQFWTWGWWRVGGESWTGCLLGRISLISVNPRNPGGGIL